MRWLALIVVSVVAETGAVLADEPFAPHRMMTAEGQPDPEKCTICHTSDMSLVRPKAELCVSCHTTICTGMLEHVHRDPKDVERLLPKEEGAPTLPLTEDGRIFCGTCHLYHDPAISGEEPLAEAWVPPRTEFTEETRRALADALKEIAKRHGEPSLEVNFMTKPTRALRMPVHDGGLCRHCHRDQP
jgi:hypothetical protein